MGRYYECGQRSECDKICGLDRSKIIELIEELRNENQELRDTIKVMLGAKQ